MFKIKIYISYLLFQILPLISFSQLIGLPQVISRSENSVETQMTNWAVECDKHGIIYLGNDMGVFIFAANRWLKIFSPPNKTGVRSVKEHKNRIFVGMSGDFGFLTKASNGTYLYQSLLPEVNKNHRNFSEVWNVESQGEKVIFQSFDYIFIYENNKLTTIKPHTQFLNLYVVNNKILTKQFEKGIFEINDDTLSMIPQGDFFANKDAFSIVSHKENNMLIFTAFDGIFLYNNGNISEWASQHNSFFSKNPITVCIQSRDKKYIIGTVSNGLIVMDENGEVVLHLNKYKGLKSNTIVDVETDNSGDIWLTSNNGVEYVPFNSKFKYIDERLGLNGSVYDFKIVDNILYVATNEGVYVSDLSKEFQYHQDKRFHPLSGYREQVWSLKIIDRQMYGMTRLGTYLVNTNNLVRLQGTNNEGVWKLVELRPTSDIVLQGTYNGLNLFRKTSKGIEYQRKIKGFTYSSRIIEIDKDENIWVAHPSEGIFKLRLNATMDSVSVSKFFVDKTEIANRITHLSVIDNEVFAYIDGLIYNFNKTNNKFELNQKLNKALHAYFPIKQMRATAHNSCIFYGGEFMNEKAGTISNLKSNISISLVADDNLHGVFIHNFEFFSQINQTQYAFASRKGIILYNNLTQPSVASNFNTIISAVTIGNSDSISAHYFDSPKNANTLQPMVRLPYIDNNIQFNFFSTSYKQNAHYSTFLEGLDKDWSNWQNENRREYTNLREGIYTFWVKSKNATNEVSDVAYFRFEILPPWYRTIYAYFVYVALGFMGIFILYRLRQVQLAGKAKKIRFEEIIKYRKEKEIILNEKYEAEKVIIELKNEKLKSELEHKTREITASTIHVMQLNETLTEIENKLNEYVETAKLKDKTELRKIIELINLKINNTDEWEKFEFHFNQIHQDFLNRLKTDFPELSNREIRLCAYLRMNLSSKEIAPLLGINFRSVETLRYRTRKKLNLETSQSLTDYIIRY